MNVVSREVRLADVADILEMQHMFALLTHSESLDAIELQPNTVGDAQESPDDNNTLHTNEHQTISQPVTVHSSLDAIVGVCDGVRAMDLKTISQVPPRKWNQASVLRSPHNWILTPK